MKIIAKKYPYNNYKDNERTVCSLKEIEKRKIVEHNDLITSVAKMDKVPLKIFELAVSLIDTDNPPKNNTIYLSKTELFAFFKVDDSNKHSRFKEAIMTLHQQSVFEIREMNVHKNKFEYRVISPLEETTWNDYNDIISMTFTKSIMPYLIELKTKFTQYALSDLVELNSKYSIILYKWLSMNYNQYEHYSNKGGRRAEQVEAYRNPSITVKELRTITDTVNEHKHFPHFENRVLKKGIEEINAHTSFNVSYEKVKKGRSIDSIVFHIEKKRRADDNSYKLDDKAYQDDKTQKETDNRLLAGESLQSPYTKLLSENMLLFPNDFMDIKTMAGLQKNVYPLYDELKDLRGLNGVKDHLSYVSSKKEAYSKRNVAKYLKKAIEQYLPTVKRQDL
ncbi:MULTISPECIES: RepB family plasmid replication initiator protein [Lactococcus]|jgi:plasmid replication initiation protein|uniref:RepB n=1 Tax=Lactococcus lactis subsp. lactis TaxID=1360 RepID=A0A0V8ED58_LACLL|nr:MULTISPECIES: RepB family plasmid replication initiator protein [Lactococcus]KSU23757.1 RepB [Lactococcus lactis subsp. lactis]KZK54607.1 RepB [Lactococcus cremoris]MRM45136.1 RepB family plasmid replication initiator protein [Lactococcus cremoris]UXV62287.1 RepB family plasmid replication initiator protein [Lactococcus cremoris]